MKKILTLVLALVLVLGLAAPAFAADDETYTITMNTTENHTYAAFQIFRGDLAEKTEGEGDDAVTSVILSNIEWGYDVDGPTLLGLLKNPTLIDDREALGYVPASGDTPASTIFSDCTTAREVAEVLSGYADDSATVKAFARLAYKSIPNDIKEDPYYVSEVKDGKIVIEGLDAGYYIVVDTTKTEDLPEGQTISDFMLRVVEDVTITAKDSVVTVDKMVADINDSASTSSYFSNTEPDTADWDIGDTIPYKVVGTLPSNFDDYYLDYEYILVDNFSKGLTFDKDSLVVKIYETADATEPVMTEEVPIGGSRNWDVVFTENEDGTSRLWVHTDLMIYLSTEDGGTYRPPATAIIVFEYTCTLNEDAVVGAAGNPNTAHIEFTSGPNTSGKGKTPDDIVTVFTFELDVNKVDDEGKALSGATFKLSKLLSDGKNHPLAQVGMDGVITESYRYGNEWKEIDEIAVSENGEKFTAKFIGLDDGVYKLEETVTPEGYNTVDTIYFEVVTVHEEDENGVGKVVSISIYEGKVKENKEPLVQNQAKYEFSRGTQVSGNFSIDTEFLISTDIVNKPGSVLPSTGGIGTTIFYIVGAILVIGAGVLLVAKRRVNE